MSAGGSWADLARTRMESRPPADRALVMAESFRSGLTLQQIGDTHGLTRERVRQIISKIGVRRNQGGQAVQKANRASARAAQRDSEYMQRFGCTFAQYRELRAIGREMTAKGSSIYRAPLRAYCIQRRNAATRGIEWRLTLWQWWEIWRASGKWGERGRGQGYVMGRNGDAGPYAVGNVCIITAVENSSVAPRKKRTNLPRGVTNHHSGHFTAWRNLNGERRYLGAYLTPDEAHQAYIANQRLPGALVDRASAATMTCPCGKPRQRPGKPCKACRAAQDKRYKARRVARIAAPKPDRRKVATT